MVSHLTLIRSPNVTSLFDTPNLLMNTGYYDQHDDWLYLYFDPSSKHLRALVQLLTVFQDDLTTVVRYRSNPSDSRGFEGGKKIRGGNAGGWGVEMVLKKMEYNSLDDRADRGNKQGSDTIEDRLNSSQSEPESSQVMSA